MIEKGEFFWDEEEEIEVPEQSVRFFKSEDYQYLLSKTLVALDFNDSPGGEDQGNIDLKCSLKGNEDFIPRSSSNEDVFHFPGFFEKQLKAEWTKPMANR